MMMISVIVAAIIVVIIAVIIATITRIKTQIQSFLINICHTHRHIFQRYKLVSK